MKFAEQEEPQQQAVAALERYIQQLEILRDIDTSVIKAESIQMLVAGVIKRIRQLIPCQRASFCLVDQATNEMLFFVVDSSRHSALGSGSRISLSSSWFEGFNTNFIRVIDDLRLQPNLPPAYQQIVKEGMISALHALFVIGDQPLGFLTFATDTPGAFRPEHQEMAAQVANHLATAVHRLQLTEQVAQHTMQLEQHVAELKRTKEALSRSEERYRRVVEEQTDLICRFQPDLKITFVNQAYRLLMGKPIDALIGQSILDDVPPAYHDYVVTQLAALNAARPMSTSENPVLVADGSQRWFHRTDRVIFDNRGQILEYQSVGRDITERKQAEAAEREQRRFAEALRDSLAALTSSSDVESVMQQILASAANVVPSDAGSIILYEGDQGRVAYLRGFTAEAIAFFRDYRFSLRELTPEGMRTKTQPYLVPDTTVWQDWLLLPGTDWIRSSLGVPIESNGEFIGLLVVDSAMPNYFRPDDIAKLQSFAHYAGLALAKSYHINTLEQRVAARTAELQAEKERVEAILNNSHDAILLVHPDLCIQQTNTTFALLFAYENDDCTSCSLLDFIHVDDIKRLQAEIQVVIDEQCGRQIELRACRPHGAFFEAELSISQIKNNGMVCILRDISERKQHERQLRYYASLQANVSDAVISTDLETKIQSWNQAAEAIYGWRADEVIGKPTEILRNVYTTPAAREHALQELFYQGHWQGEVVQHRKDGTPLHILGSVTLLRDEKGVPFGIVAINRDITEQKRAVAALDESRRFAQRITETAPNIIYIHDLQKGGNIYINHNVAALLGYSPQEIADMGASLLAEIMHPADAATFPHHLAQIISAADGLDFAFEYRMRDKRGAWHWFLSRDTVFQRDAVGNVTQFLGIATDITELKAAQEAIRNSEARYRLLADNITDWVTRTNTLGEYIYVSPSVHTMLGYEPEEMLGQSFYTLIHPDDIAAIQLSYRAVLEENAPPPIFTYRARHKAGHYLWLETKSQPVYSAATGAILEYVATSRDITERKLAEDALRESEEKFRRLVEVAPVAIIITDETGDITLVNDQAQLLFSYPRVELLDQSVELLVPDYARKSHAHNRAAYMAAPRVRRMGIGLELFARRKDGSQFPVEIELSYVQTATGLMVMSFIIDITERKQADADLRAQRDFLQLVINSVPDLIMVKDRAGRFQLVNEPAAHLFDLTTATMVGKTDADINPHSEEIAFFRQKDQETLAQQRPIFIPEEMILNRYYQTSKIPLQSPTGLYERLLVVASDITERKRAEETLQQALQKEKELGELKSRFVSMASHEFRTPLATILVLTETLSAYRHKMTDAQIEQRFVKMRDQIGHLKDIMEDVLQLARMQERRVEFNPTVLDPDALCRSVIDEFENQPGVQQRLLYTCVNTIPHMHLDRRLLRQVITNLVSNALKYSAEEQVVQISLAYAEKTLIFQVRDEGIGIPEIDLKHLFQPFHRSANVGAIPGTGLGLTIAKESVDLHGGAITVQSKLGDGATFTVTLPMVSRGEKSP